MDALWVLLVGFVLGVGHATDTDHVIAVSTIVTRERRVGAAAVLGLLWGAGHTLTILVVGGAIVLLGLVVPPRLGLGLEFGVALMLVVLGVLNLRATLGWLGTAGDGRHGPGGRHSHAHRHGDFVHSHPHGHGPDEHGHDEDRTPTAWLDHAFGRLSLYRVMRPVVVGVVHGLAGSAAPALLGLAAVRDPLWAVGYLLVFGLGTAAGMLAFTAMLALPVASAARRWAGAHQVLGVAAGVVSLAWGLALAYHVGLVEGLFDIGRRGTPG